MEIPPTGISSLFLNDVSGTCMPMGIRVNLSFSFILGFVPLSLQKKKNDTNVHFTTISNEFKFVHRCYTN